MKASSYLTEISRVTSPKAPAVNIFGSADPAKILVVDDSSFSRLMAIDLLRPKGYQILECDGTTDVVASVLAHSPDLILLDVILPFQNGFEVCQQLKQDQRTKGIPVILMTVAEDNQVLAKSQEVCADGFLSKPLERMLLLPKVELLIQSKRLKEWLEQMQQVLFLLAQAIEGRYADREESDPRLDKLAQSFGEYLQLSPLEINDLILATYLHDIGTVAIPDAVLMKKGKLTEEERELIKRHVLIGEKICQPMQSRQGVAQIIRHHHERWDGSGYPDGLRGDEIPWLAQVFQILDIYDALTSQRPHKQALSSEEALAIIAEETAKGWRNPELVGQFTAFIQQKNK